MKAEPMTKKLWRKLPEKFTDEVLSVIEELAATGLNKGQISTKLKFDHNAFHRYKETAEAFKQGRVTLAVAVAKSFKANLDFNYNDRLYIARQLRLFDTNIEVQTIKDIDSARAAMALVTEEYIRGNCSHDMVEATRKLCQTYVDLEMGTHIESRLADIEAAIAEKDRSHG